MSLPPDFVKAPRRSSAVVSIANPNLDGTGAVEPLITAGLNGSKIDCIHICAPATATFPETVNLFLNGKYFDRIVPNAWVFNYVPAMEMRLVAGDVLAVSTVKASVWNVTAFGWDY